MKNKIKVAIADDHPIFIDGIKTALSDSPEIELVGEANNGLEIIEIVKTQKPDLVLLDIMMPELDGIDAAKIIKKLFQDVKIIILTQFDERGLIRRCQQIGVKGYLLKDCGKQVLINAIRKVYKGGILFSIDKANITKFQKAGRIRSENNVFSSRELEILLLMANDNCSAAIAKELKISGSTVRTYKQRMFLKTGTDTSSGLINWAYKQNIL